MKTVFQKRDANILLRAQKEGFEFDFYDSLENQIFEAERYLINHCDIDAWEYCEVDQSGHHQHVAWSDGQDLDFSADGQITDWSRKKLHIDEDGNHIVRIPHEIVVDSDAKIIQLFDERERNDCDYDFEFEK